jgi:hypothetical protein
MRDRCVYTLMRDRQIHIPGEREREREREGGREDGRE